MKKAYFLAILGSAIAAVVGVLVQLNGQSKVSDKCSYLDPIIIDIIATLGALFLIIEGCYRMYQHKKDSVKQQFTRIVRVSIGFAILAIHILQFIHK